MGPPGPMPGMGAWADAVRAAARANNVMRSNFMRTSERTGFFRSWPLVV